MSSGCQAPEHLLIPQVAVPDVVQAASEADILIFVVPHQFIGKICDQLKGHLKANAIGISLIKVPETPSCGWVWSAASCGVHSRESKQNRQRLE